MCVLESWQEKECRGNGPLNFSLSENCLFVGKFFCRTFAVVCRKLQRCASLPQFCNLRRCCLCDDRRNFSGSSSGWWLTSGSKRAWWWSFCWTWWRWRSSTTRCPTSWRTRSTASTSCSSASLRWSASWSCWHYAGITSRSRGTYSTSSSSSSLSWVRRSLLLSTHSIATRHGKKCYFCTVLKELCTVGILRRL